MTAHRQRNDRIGIRKPGNLVAQSWGGVKLTSGAFADPDLTAPSQVVAIAEVKSTIQKEWRLDYDDYIQGNRYLAGNA